MAPRPTDRFLRSPALRNVLYESAGGRCTRCGDLLPDDWHADHVEPWRRTHTTNVFDMEALCPKCNRAKGAKMDSSASINLNAGRPGQREAVQKIWDIVRTMKRTATIVLPTRYGKSDVIRVSAVGLMADNLVSRAVILEPASNLVVQILDKAKMEEAVTRYTLPFGHGLQTFAVRETPRLPFPPRFAQGAHFLGMTTHMANNNRQFFAEWVRKEQARSGCPPIWFIDEAHTSGRDNEWGKTVRTLQDAGAILVLLTATPFRTDRTQVEGFAYREIERGVQTSRLGDELWELERVRYELDADHITTFKEAWNERPPSLCYLSRVVIDAPLNRYSTLTGERLANRKLSELSHADARRVLPQLVRDEVFILECVERFLQVLNSRRLAFPETAGMVYVGNDNPDDEEANAHANQVAEALHNLAPDLNLVIATSSTEDGAEQLHSFQQGTGDVLVVKQMGGVGMDVHRLKVCLDLSTVRTLQAYTQRSCRILTLWNPTGEPEDLVLTGTYITPFDKPGDTLWKEFVQKEGGDAETRVTAEYLGRVQNDIRSRQEYLPDTFVLAGGTTVGGMVDSQDRSAPGEQWSDVQQLTSIFPELTKARTEAEIGNTLSEHGINFKGATPAPVNAVPQQQPVPNVTDLYSEQKSARERVNTLARRVARKRQGIGAVDEQFGEIIKAVYVRHKQQCGLTYRDGASLKDLSSESLSKLAESLARELEASNDT